MAEEPIYSVELSQRAAKELRKLDRTAQVRIIAALGLLAAHPKPASMKPLTGFPGYLRVRVGDYRIIYTLDNGKLRVLVLSVAHRSSVYKALP